MPVLNSSKIQEAVEGAAAPEFVLPDENGVDWRLSDQTGNVTVLLFYPRNETLVCTRQMCSVRDNWARYLETKAVIVGVSSGDANENKDFSDHHRLPIPLLADTDRSVTSIYGRHFLFPIALTRAVAVIDAKGIIRTRQILLRAFRPKDDKVIRAIYAARGDALGDRYEDLKKRAKNLNNI